MPQFEFTFVEGPVPGSKPPPAPDSAPTPAPGLTSSAGLYVIEHRDLTPEEEEAQARFEAWSEAQEQMAMYTRYGSIPEDVRANVERLFRIARGY